MANAGRVWFTSDWHIGHRFVAGLRGFEDVTEHDQALCDNWADVVRKGDVVWMLGDLCLSKPTRALMLLQDLPGVKHLVLGNHDLAHPMHRYSHKWQRQYFEAFESVQMMARRRVNQIEVLLSHFPYSMDSGFESRYPQYRLPDEGRWLIHGHIHSSERFKGHEIHVGVDAWNLKPVALDLIVGHIESSDYIVPVKASLDTT